MRSLLLLLVAGCASRAAAPPPVAAPHRAAARPVAIATAPVEPAPPPPPPAPAAGEPQAVAFIPTAADQVLAHRLLDLIDQLAAVMEREQNACDRMAVGLELVIRRNQDLVAAGRAMKVGRPRDKWLQEQAMARLEKALPRMLAGFQKCQNDARLQALFRTLGS